MMTNSVHIPNDRGEARQSRATARYNTDVLKRVLACLPLTIGVVVEVGNRLTKCYNAISKSGSCAQTREGVPFTPVVGAYSKESKEMDMDSGRGGAFGKGPTSGAP